MTDQERDKLGILIQALQNDEIGLNDTRKALLVRMPELNDWAELQHRVVPEDLVWLTTKTGDSFVLCRGENTDVLLHRDKERFIISGLLLDMLGQQTLRLVARCSPGNWVLKMY